MVPRLRPHLWLNPWADKPFTGRRLWASTTVDPETATFRDEDATTSLSTLLGLVDDSPPGAPFPH
jgi:hypothetical protein